MMNKKAASRGRTRKMESFADWMVRMDTQVEAMAARVCTKPPAERLLNQHQRRIVEMLIEHMRSLPRLAVGENPYKKKEYDHVNVILTKLFEAKYPEWKQRTADGLKSVDAIPNGESAVFHRLLRNCAGRAPEKVAEYEDDD
jgi:hypothetical protein